MSEQTKKPFTILAPTDFSIEARAALERAIRIADALDGTIVLMHVIDVYGLGDAPGSSIGYAELAEEIRTGAEIQLGRLAEAVDPARRRVRRIEIRDGGSADAIVRFAADLRADLIVIGSHGRTGLSRFFMGSVSERVVRHAPCDVMVVRGSHVAARVAEAAAMKAATSA